MLFRPVLRGIGAPVMRPIMGAADNGLIPVLKPIYLWNFIDGIYPAGEISYTRPGTKMVRMSNGDIRYAGANQPRMTHDYAGNRRGLAISGGDTQRFLRTDSANLTWIAEGLQAINVDVRDSPTGETSGVTRSDQLVESATTLLHGIRQSVSVVAGWKWVFDAVFEPDARGWIYLSLPDAQFGGVTNRAWFDLTSVATGAVSGNNAESFIRRDKVGHVWCRMKADATAGGSGDFGIFGATGDGADTYTGTAGATLGYFAFASATFNRVDPEYHRSDDIQVSTSEDNTTSPVAVPAEGLTCVVEIETPWSGRPPGNAGLLAFDDGGNQNMITPKVEGTTWALQVVSGGVQSSLTGLSQVPTDGRVYRMAFSVNADGGFACDSEGVGSTVLAGTMPVGVDTLRLGYYLGGNRTEWHMRRVHVYEGMATPAQLRAAVDLTGNTWNPPLLINPIGDSYYLGGQEQPDMDTVLPLTRGSVAWEVGESLLLEQWGANQWRDRCRSPITGIVKGARIEEPSTSYALQANGFDQSPWATFRATVTADATTAPDGTTTADKLVEDATAANSHGIRQVFTGTAVRWSESLFVKPAEREWLYLRMFDGTSYVFAGYFNATDGYWGTIETGAPTDFEVENSGAGWYRVGWQGTLTASGSCEINIGLANADGGSVYDGDGTSGLYLWWGQAEPYDRTTSPIGPSVASALTRAGEVCRRGQLSEFTGVRAGYVEFYLPRDLANWGPDISLASWASDDQTTGTPTDEYEVVYRTGQNAIQFTVRANGVEVIRNQSPLIVNSAGLHRVAFSCESGRNTLYVNGIKANNYLTGSATQGFSLNGLLDNFCCAGRADRTNHGGYLRQVRQFDHPLSDDEADTLTAGTFTPLDAPQCDGWWDSRLGPVVQGQGVRTWYDLSFFSNNMAQRAGGRQPSLDGLINGLEAVRFDGVGQSMEINGLAKFLANRQPFSLFAVVQFADTAGFYNILGAGNSSDSNPLIEIRQTPTHGLEVIMRDDDASPEGAVSGGTPGTEPRVIGLTYAGGLSGALRGYINGSQVFNVPYNASSTVQTLDQVRAAAGYIGGAEVNHGKLDAGSIVAYGREVTDAVRDLITAYLASQFGILGTGPNSFGFDFGPDFG